jgi:polysaccharide biosynthesis/export protein
MGNRRLERGLAAAFFITGSMCVVSIDSRAQAQNAAPSPLAAPVSALPPVAAAPNGPAVNQPKSGVALKPVAPAATTVGPDYVIGPGDVVDVFVWRNPELSTTVPVRPDGKISSPLVSEVVATGRTAVQLAHDIEAILATYIRAPQVNVIVRSAQSASSQIRVVGQAAAPKAIPYRDGLTVLDVVIAVGGLGEFAAGNRAKIVRTGPDGKTRELKVKLKKLMESGDMSQNLRMQPGDVLVIPESVF